MNKTQVRTSAASRWGSHVMSSVATTRELASAAWLLADSKIPVFPCAPRGKQPLTLHGFHDASTDLTTVGEWWHRWPDANIGVPTGSVSGVDVVDVDVHVGGAGFGAFERARTAGLVNGWAWLVRTPSGGIHAYFPRCGAVEQRSWQVPGAHVDFRGDGGYIIAPPSRVAAADGQSHSYELIAVAQHRVEPVDAAGLRALLEPPPRTRPPSDPTLAGVPPEKLADWVASRPEGARNHGLFWAACRMVEDGHPFDTTRDLLGEAARVAGLSEHEAATTIRSAYRTTSGLGVGTARPSVASEVVSR